MGPVSGRGVRLDLAALMTASLPPTLKGVPTRAAGASIEQLREMGLSLLDGDLPLPVAILKRDRLQHNALWMQAFTKRAGVELCPHGKTTMSPQLFQMQFDHGAWGMTAATASHVRTYRQYGVPRIILANQLVGRANIELVFDELEADPGFDFYLLVDSVEALRELETALDQRPLPRPLQVLLEVGVKGGRTGVRSVESGTALGRAIAAAGPRITLRGIEAFEAVFSGSDHARIELSVLATMDRIAALLHTGVEESWFGSNDIILSAGGSAFFDLVAQALHRVEDAARITVVLRSGCYLSHDALHYERMQARLRQRAGELWGEGPGLENALEVWAYVQSVPEPGRAICSLGKRDVSYDIVLPRPIWWYRPGYHERPLSVPVDFRVSALNDQHAYVDASEDIMNWQVGDMIGFGVGHPCTTFDKWPLMYVVDESYKVFDAVRTFF